MTTQTLRKTHPMVLTAAAALTIFSIIGSAAITGLIPSAHSGSSQAETLQAVPANDAHGTTGPQQNDSLKSSASSKGETNPSAKVAEKSGAKDKPSLATKDGRKVAACSICGVIESIRTVEQEGDGSGLGAVAGGVVGGVVGNQVGKGKGNTLMTIIGLGGGAYAGHEIEKNMKSTTAYIVKVRMQDGTYRSVTLQSEPEYAVGDHVKVTHGSLTAA